SSGSSPPASVRSRKSFNRAGTPGAICAVRSPPFIKSVAAKRSSSESCTSMPLRKLVTGVTGFVGSHLAYRLLRDGHHVIALARGGKNVSARERVVEVLSEVA